MGKNNSLKPENSWWGLGLTCFGLIFTFILAFIFIWGPDPRHRFASLVMWEESILCIILGMGFPLNKNFLYEKKERGYGQAETQQSTSTSCTSHLKGKLTEWVSCVWTFSSESQIVLLVLCIRNESLLHLSFPPSSGPFGLKQWYQCISWTCYFVL